MQCARTRKKVECGGEGMPVTGESGVLWGWQCSKCRQMSQRCQVCGRAFITSRHLTDSPDCGKGNPLSRTHAAVKRVYG